jgi:hypothetical protein
MKTENDPASRMTATARDRSQVGATIDSSLEVNGRGFGRRSFVKQLAVGGALLLPLGKALAADAAAAAPGNGISDGDADILRFLAAAELIETDLWQQYADFVLVDSPFTKALETIDDHMPTYTVQNTTDEFSHQDFLNAFLVRNHKTPVDLEPFRTLPSSPVAPKQMKRLTNLQHLNVDTSCSCVIAASRIPTSSTRFRKR